MIVLPNDRQVDLPAALSSDCRLCAIHGLSVRNAIRLDASHEQARLAVPHSLSAAQANHHG